MELGIFLPVVSLPPRFTDEDWQLGASIDDLAAVARTADAAGYRFLCAPEHVAMPVSRRDTRGSRYWDPFSTLGYLAAVTEQIQLVTYVLPLAYHHPLDIVKRAGTLDQVSKGRVHVGVGVGSLVEEFELLGADFEQRGPQADDALAAIRASLGKEVVSYHGPFYDYDDFIVDPGLRSDTSIWIGGQSKASLRRALQYGDYWSPFNLSADAVVEMLGRPAAKEAAAGRETPLKVAYYQSDRRADPLGAPDRIERLLEQLAEVEITRLVVHMDSHSREHYEDQVQALAELASPY
jgi:probable F420-dependent oxidoreductase